MSDASARLELATALLPFAMLTDDTGVVGAAGYDPSVIIRFEATAGEIQVARETLLKWFPNLAEEQRR